MDHDLSVEPLRARCTCFLEHILQVSDLHRVATASRAIFAPRREVAHEVLQATITLEAQPLKRADVAPGGPDTRARYLHTRMVSPQTWCGQVHIPVRTFQCRG